MAASLFSLSIPQLQQWSQRQVVDHRRQNEPVEAINRMTTGIGPPRMKAGAPIAVSPLAQFKLTQNAAMFFDHLVCRTWDGESEGIEDIAVAKPWLLQRTPFDQLIRDDVLYDYSDGVTRVAYDNTDPEMELKRDEQIHPRYHIDDIIIAASVVTGLTIQDTPVLWVDLNVGGRGWHTYYEWL